MSYQFGQIYSDPCVYKLNKIPKSGNFEFIYKNKSIFLKVDQFGLSLIQHNPPSGMYVLQRKDRETFSPFKYFFHDGKKIVHNFDVYSAKNFEIRYFPYKAEYELHFSNIDVITTIVVDPDNPQILMKVEFFNHQKTDFNCLSIAYFDPVDTTMAIWDKKEWYYSTEVDGTQSPLFLMKHYSVNGIKNERNNILFLQDKNCESLQNSAEKLRYFTKNFTKIPSTISDSINEKIVCYDQACGCLFTLKDRDEINSLICVDKELNIHKNDLLSSFQQNGLNLMIEKSKNQFNSLFEKRTIKTSDNNFDNFVNNFLPLEVSWVTDLDRGWPTGMRGSRDCANDFMGYLLYDLPKCRELISVLLNNERFVDGWFPRQIPFNGSNKYDLRPFSDSGAFIIELVYEYLCYSNDFSLLDETFSYLNSEHRGSGLEHLIKAAKYYCLNENIGEHNLIKLHGGDWLDCLNRVGIEGRGETLMVTCQAILAFKQVSEILQHYGETYKNEIEIFREKSSFFKSNIIKYCYINEEGFYRSVFGDDGNWYFSEKDLDNFKRIYIPSNAYALIAEVNTKNDKKVIKQINKNNETKSGFVLFTTPFGEQELSGIGKMGTGDFAPYMFENGAVYNHGANLFYSRALCNVGDYKTLYRALNYSLPYNSKYHPESISCLPAYACTNAYNLLPTYYGRGGLSFLTGSISMIIRTVFNWMFGIDFHIDYLRIKPCIPKQYKDAVVKETYNNFAIKIQYIGYGNNVADCNINGEFLELTNKEIIINKKTINRDMDIVVRMNTK